MFLKQEKSKMEDFEKEKKTLVLKENTYLTKKI